MDSEIWSTVASLISTISIVVSLIFVAYQINLANKLARAEAQRNMRHIWQENLYYIADNGSEFQELLQNYEGMKPERQIKGAHALITVGNHLDMLIKLESQGLESVDNVRWMLDAFCGFVSTPGGYQLWKIFYKANLFGDNVIQAVNLRLSQMEVPNNDLVDVLTYRRFERGPADQSHG